MFVYRVISADSHPVAGAITFTIGEASAASDAVVADVVGGSDLAVSALGGVNRWGGYAGVILLIGLPAFIALCRRDGARDPCCVGSPPPVARWSHSPRW